MFFSRSTVISWLFQFYYKYSLKKLRNNYNFFCCRKIKRLVKPWRKLWTCIQSTVLFTCSEIQPRPFAFCVHPWHCGSSYLECVHPQSYPGAVITVWSIIFVALDFSKVALDIYFYNIIFSSEVFIVIVWQLLWIWKETFICFWLGFNSCSFFNFSTFNLIILKEINQEIDICLFTININIVHNKF